MSDHHDYDGDDFTASDLYDLDRDAEFAADAATDADNTAAVQADTEHS